MIQFIICGTESEKGSEGNVRMHRLVARPRPADESATMLSKIAVEIAWDTLRKKRERWHRVVRAFVIPSPLHVLIIPLGERAAFRR